MNEYYIVHFYLIFEIFIFHSFIFYKIDLISDFSHFCTCILLTLINSDCLNNFEYKWIRLFIPIIIYNALFVMDFYNFFDFLNDTYIVDT